MLLALSQSLGVWPMDKTSDCFRLAQGRGWTKLCSLGKALEILSCALYLYRPLCVVIIHTQGDIFCGFLFS